MLNLTIQVELIWSLIITAFLIISFYFIGKKVKAADPLKRPKGVVLVAETGVRILYDYFKDLLPEKFAKNYYPYFSVISIFILISNISGLLAIENPTSNFSITLALTLVTFTLIQLESIRAKGGVNFKGLFVYFKGLMLPPTNLLGALAPLISLSMRLFGNVLAGSILMYLVYSFTGWLSNMIIPFNFLGPILTPVLHGYFDVFAGFIQTIVFVTLSAVLIRVEMSED